MAQIAGELRHYVADDHAGHAVLSFLTGWAGPPPAATRSAPPSCRPGGWAGCSFLPASNCRCSRRSPPATWRCRYGRSWPAAPFYPHHIAERYGLFTLIVLDESVLSATTAVRSAVDTHEATARLFTVAAGGLLIVFSMWWLYLAKPAAGLLLSLRMASSGTTATTWCSARPPPSARDSRSTSTTPCTTPAVGRVAAAAAGTLPVALFLVVLWLLHIRPHQVGSRQGLRLPLTAALVLAATLLPAAVLVTGLLTAALVAASTIPRHPSR